MTPHLARRIAAAAITLTLALGGCASLDGPRQFTISEAELTARMAEQFPIERRWLELIDVQFEAPRLHFDAGDGRLRAELQARLGEQLWPGRFGARMTLRARPRYEPSDHTIRLQEVSIDRLDLDTGSDSLLRRAGRLPAALLAQGLEDAPVYRLRPEQIERLQRQGLAVQSVAVAGGGVQFTLAPVR